MVKADVKKDYYAELGVSPSADTDEIKRQFRKLALKYHPDRNPGREAECITKFQAIQAAHEILCDPPQRLKYDTERLRAGYGKYYGPSQTNPLKRANTTAHRPSTPTATATTARPAAQRNSFSQRSTAAPSTGAQRYANYAKAAPAQPWEKAYGETRAEAFRGFQDMKPNAGMSGWASFDPFTGRMGHPAGRGATSAAPPSPRQRPTSAYEHIHPPRKDFTGPTRTASIRRTGFAPGTPGGDEPMARNVSSYRNERTQARNSTSFFDSAPPPKAPQQMASEGIYKSTNEEFGIPELDRHSSRYAWRGGEKTYVTVDEIPRSPRGRSRTNPPSPTSPVPGRYHHSASPKLKTDRMAHNLPSSTSSSDIGDDDGDDDEDCDDDDDDDDDDDYHHIPATTSRRKATPKSRLRPNQKFSDFCLHKDWNSGSGEESIDRSRLRATFNTSRPHSYHEDMSQRTEDEYYRAHESDSTSFPNQARGRSPNLHITRESIYETASGNTGASHSSGNKTQEHTQGRRHERDAKGISADDLSDSLRNSKFFASTTSSYDDHATNSETSSSRAPNLASQSSDDSRSRQPPPPSIVGESFSAETWSRRLGDKNWAMPAPEPNKQQKANRRAERSPRKQSRGGVKLRPNPRPAAVSSEQDEEADRIPKAAPTGLGGSSLAAPEAMELDESAVPKTKIQPSTSNNHKINNEKTDDGLFDLKELNNVRPLSSKTSGGIDDLQDMQASLPFESRSNTVNMLSRKPIQPRSLELPNPPKSPPQPGLISLNGDPRNMILPRKAWVRYVGEIEAYMSEWNRFNRRMLAHFNTRQDAVESGLSPGWIRAVSDSTKLNINATDGDGNMNGDGTPTLSIDLSINNSDDDDVLVPGKQSGGYSAYIRGVEEDFKVRAHWEIAWEGHRICMLQFGQIRHWLRTTGKLGP